MVDDGKEQKHVQGLSTSTRPNNRWWWGLPSEELDRITEEAYRRQPIQPDEFISENGPMWPSDPDEDAFWEEFYQAWLKEQNEPSS